MTDTVSRPHVTRKHDHVAVRLMDGYHNFHGFDERLELIHILDEYVSGRDATRADFAAKLLNALRSES